MSQQFIALILSTKVGHLIAGLFWPVRVPVLIPVVLALFGLADIVADEVDDRVERAG